MAICRLVKGGVCSTRGFRTAGVAAGIKYKGLNDVALIVADEPCAAAAMFTTNKVAAAPVVYDRAIVRGDRVQAILANSGCANACTGEQGMKDVCITFGSRVRFALENVLRFAGVMPRTRDSSAAYIFEASTISLRLNRCRNCESISRYTCELYENFLALTFSSDAISSIFHPGMCSCTIWAKHDIILFRVALGFLLLIVYPFVCFGRHELYTTRAAQGNAQCCASPV